MKINLKYPKDPVWEIDGESEELEDFVNSLFIFADKDTILCIEHANISADILNHISRYKVETEFHPHKNTTWPKSKLYFFNFSSKFYSEFKSIINQYNSCEFIDHFTLFDSTGNVLIDYADFGSNQFHINQLPKKTSEKFISNYTGNAKLVNHVYGT